MSPEYLKLVLWDFCPRKDSPVDWRIPRSLVNLYYYMPKVFHRKHLQFIAHQSQAKTYFFKKKKRGWQKTVRPLSYKQLSHPKHMRKEIFLRPTGASAQASLKCTWYYHPSSLTFLSSIARSRNRFSQLESGVSFIAATGSPRLQMVAFFL